MFKVKGFVSFCTISGQSSLFFNVNDRVCISNFIQSIEHSSIKYECQLKKNKIIKFQQVLTKHFNNSPRHTRENSTVLKLIKLFRSQLLFEKNKNTFLTNQTDNEFVILKGNGYFNWPV